MKQLTPWFKRNVPATTSREEEYPFYALQKEMNNLFESFFSQLDRPFVIEGAFGDFTPTVDMKDSAKEIIITAELPGLDPKDVQLKLAGDVLTIAGEKKTEKEEDVKGHYRMERVFGSFSRSLLLPSEVELGKCSATFKNGLLTVVLPKTKEAEKVTKTIPINS